MSAGPPLQLTVRRLGRRYQAQIHDPGIGRRWRCPHQRPTPALASQADGVMARRVRRFGWQRATGRQYSTLRAPDQPG